MGKTKKDPELEYWEEDRDRLNRMAETAKKLKILVPVLPEETRNEEASSDPFWNTVE